MKTIPELSFRSENGASRAWKLLRNAAPVHIRVLCEAVWRHGEQVHGADWTLRRQQMRVGPVVAHLNAQLVAHGFVIAPGVPRNTYQLREIDR